ncbi:sulfite exporter TauE/SafE family protein [Romeria aff. gracilis LEGE 07310]|uniref:Probable membrane transporter protein n=1 Tax=Vasconcelosia minhoensis LEGE 07310 TaxID=915328 RepID=A0A8J7AAV9_9CYAN|nr:sulfite exporter TauE/SafE family protein [Romeria gracilis]MBE9079435.1 sulfite exporter TauE/SafE family protein [Romeria aff. gracilis LEGE 07310]
MSIGEIATLAVTGLASGILAGFLGIGGGVLLVPMLVYLGYSPIQSAATSSLAILVTSAVGSLQNWRMGYLSLRRVLLLGFPAIVTAFIGAQVGDWIPSYLLLLGFGLLLLSNLYLVSLKKRVVAEKTRAETGSRSSSLSPTAARLITGGTAGFMAGLFGVGGGVIMVPMQILLLNEGIKSAVRTSLGVIVITSISACVGHAVNSNIVVLAGLLLGGGGLIGVQISTRFLPKLSDRTVTQLFRGLLLLLSVLIFWQAWQSYAA